MSKTKILTIVGARPQFIKASTFSNALKKRDDAFEVLLHTGQHFDTNMSEIFFQQLNIPRPNYHLGIGGGTHGQNTGRMIEAIEAILMQERPDWVVVYGDTDSTLAGALASIKLNFPIAHVEAGLRSFNRLMPEEINRILTDHASSILFAPTPTAVKNLAAEGIAGINVKMVGDVMYDATLMHTLQAEKKSRILDQLNLRNKDYVLATVHRQENTEDSNRLRAILLGLSASPLPVVMPMHPRTRKRLSALNLDYTGNLRILDPLGYLDMLILEKYASLIATDSGGVQKEAFFHRKPCMTLREETEWVELVESGWNRLVGADSLLIEETLSSTWSGKKIDTYGNGRTSEEIVRFLLE